MRRLIDPAVRGDGGVRTARWRCWTLPALGFIALAWAWSPAASLAQPANYPADFTLIAMAGGVSPETTMRIVVVDSSGGGEACITESLDRGTGDCTTTSAFSLTVAEMNAVWDALDGNDFFNLPAAFLSGQFADGSFARLTITAGGVTHTVTTQNLAIAAFDNVVLALNAVLPPASRLVYNELAP